MGLKEWAKKKAVAHWARGFEKEHPQVQKILAWLTDPAHPGRKRGIATALFLLASALKGIQKSVNEACAAQVQALLSEGVCRFNFDGTATWIGFASQFIDQVLVAGLTFSGMVMGIWGLWAAKKKGTAVDVIANPSRLDDMQRRERIEREGRDG